MTKAELEKENRSLKAQIRDMKKETKNVNTTVDKLPLVGYGVSLGEDRKFSLVKLKFDNNSNAAVIESSKVIGKNRMEIANRAKKAIVDEIVKLNKEQNK